MPRPKSFDQGGTLDDKPVAGLVGDQEIKVKPKQKACEPIIENWFLYVHSFLWSGIWKNISCSHVG